VAHPSHYVQQSDGNNKNDQNLTKFGYENREVKQFNGILLLMLQIVKENSLK